MKNALVIGGGSSTGKTIVDYLIENNFSVINIGSNAHPLADNICTDWKNLDIGFIHKNCSRFTHPIDFVFFNHNSSSLCENDFCVESKSTLETWKLIKDWDHSNWLSCQMPFLLLHTIKKNLHKDTKIGWMLSNYIKYDKKGNTDYPDYSSFKYFNYLQMKCFGTMNNFKTFGIYPNLEVKNSDEILRGIISQVLCSDKINDEYYF